MVNKRTPPEVRTPDPRALCAAELRSLADAVKSLMGYVSDLRIELMTEIDELRTAVLAEIGRIASLLADTRKQIKASGVDLEDSKIHDMRYLNEQMQQMQKYDRLREKERHSESKWLRRRVKGRAIDIIVTVLLTAMAIGLVTMAYKLLTK